tara:strand:+ start:22389 stop:23603 length:1215 start_codon:yes stop_codon:yes gene_type:complete
MAKLLRLRRGTTSQHSSFTGAEGEVSIDTDKEVPVVHDGSTAGGHPVAAEDMANVSSASIIGRLAAGSIATAKIADDAIDGDKIANNAITAAHIADGTVVAADIAANAVGTSEIAADAVTGAEIADDAINSEHYVDGSVDHQHLSNDCIDGDNIQDDVINSEHIAAGAVDLEHMSSESVDEDNLHISNAGSNGQYLQKQSGNAGGLTWETVDLTTLSASNLTSGTIPDARFPATLPAVSGANLTGVQPFPSGTKMLFNQTSAPTGWTKVTSNVDNRALRFVSGSAGSGGSVAFTTAFANQSVAGSVANTTAGGSVGNHTISTSQMPSHNHKVNFPRQNTSGGGGPVHPCMNDGTGGALNHYNQSTGGSGSHNHSFSGSAHNHSFSGTAINLAVQYIDVIIATKD